MKTFAKRHGLAATLCALPFAAGANSNDVQPGFFNVYDFTPDCVFCHASSSGETPTASSPFYGRQLLSRINVVDAAVPSFDRNDRNDLRQIYEFLDPTFSPTLRTAGSQSANTSGVTNFAISPSVGNNTIPLVFNGGLTNTGGSTSLRSLTVSSSFSESLTSPSGNTSTLTLALSDSFVRGRSAARSAVFPVVFTPTNSVGFKPVVASTRARNTMNVRFTNLPPIGTSESLSQSTTGRDGAIWLLDVLNNDDDPDSALAAGQTNSPPPQLGCVSSVSTGALALNASGDGLRYTLPSPLPATPQVVSFSYCPIDNEGQEGAVVNSTILLPAVSATDAPDVMDDAFPATEDLDATGDVAINDTTTPAGGALSFRVQEAPANGTVAMASDGSFTYTSALNFNGEDTFTYRADNAAGFAFGTVTMTVAPANDSPVANVTPTQEVNDLVESLVIDLLDPLYVTDIDGDALAVTDVRIGPVTEVFRAPEEIDYDPDALTTVAGSVLTVTPNILQNIDDGDSAEFTVTYDVTDGEDQVSPSITIRIVGVDNELGRQPGLYANSIRERYNEHFAGFDQQGEGACLTCHLPGRVDIDVDFRRDCEQTPAVFNDYGLTLCLDRSVGQGALTNLPERMANAEARFAPRLSLPSAPLQIDETASVGDPIGAPLSVSSAGQNIDGDATRIITYLLTRGPDQSPGQTDLSGNFRISDSGQLSVAPGAALLPGPYPLFVLPVNDAGQKNGAGTQLPGMPGFYPAENPPVVTVFVGAVPAEPNPDEETTLANLPVAIDVLANDGGGTVAAVAIGDAPANGSTAVNSDLTVTYTPAAGFVGTDTFTYVASNTAGTTDPTLVTVNVLTDGAVIARNDAVTTISGAPVMIDVLANDIGAVTAGANLTTLAIDAAPDATTVGTVRVVGQNLEFQAVEAFAGETQITYTATNPGSESTSAVVTVTVLESGSTAISDALTDPELKKVAQSFEQSCALTTDADFLQACVNITAAAVAAEDLAPVMQALRNEEHFVAVDAAQTIARTFGRGLARRISAMRAQGRGGFDLSGLNVSVNGTAIPSQLLQSLAGGVLGFSPDRPADTGDWSLFVSGDISVSDKDDSGRAAGFETTAANMMVGLEYAIDQRRDIGFALGVTNSDTDFNGGGGLKTDAVQASIYGRVDDAFGNGIDFDGFLSFGRLQYESDRRILFTANGTTVDSLALASFDGTYVNFVPTLSFSEQLGRYGDPLGDLKTGTQLQWRLGLDYLRLNIDDYTETGGAGLALSTQSETYDSLQLFLGVNADRPVWLGPRTRAQLRGGVTVYGELLDGARSVTSSFVAAGAGAPAFVVTEDGSSGLGGSLELGLSLFWDPNTLAMDYAFDRSTTGVQTHSFGVEYQHHFGRRARLNLGVQQQFSDTGGDGLNALLEYNLRF